ncbi:MAG: NAD(P)/FAD-dependent oxidoreductase [Eubacterium ramulus]
MMAACTAKPETGISVTLYEQNEKLGKKIYITGKGRCNLTNACDTEDLFAAIMKNAKFLYSAIYTFDNHATDGLFCRTLGLKMKTERGNRVFPQSDHASDVIRVLTEELRRKKVRVCLNTKVQEIVSDGTKVTGVLRWDCHDTHQKNQVSRAFDAVVAACGGVSYPTTGSDGSGFELCKKLGHTVTELRPSLIGMTTAEEYIPQLQGLSLKNVTFDVKSGKKTLYSEFGEMLFTHQGVSGPLILTASSCIPDKYMKQELRFEIDLKPALEEEQLDKRLQRDFAENVNRQFKNAPARAGSSKIDTGADRTVRH